MLNNFFIVLEHVGDNVCSDEKVMKAIRVVGYLLLIAKLCVPLIIIGMGTLDLYKAVIGGSSDAFTKQGKALIIKVLIGIFIFVFPSLLNWIVMSVSNQDEGNAQCVSCLLEPTSCDV